MSMFAAASSRVAVAPSALVASSRRPPRTRAPNRARRSSLRAGLGTRPKPPPRGAGRLRPVRGRPVPAHPRRARVAARAGRSQGARAWQDRRRQVLAGERIASVDLRRRRARGGHDAGVRAAGALRWDGERPRLPLFDTPGFFDVEGRTPAGVLRELSGKVSEFHAVVYAPSPPTRG